MTVKKIAQLDPGIYDDAKRNGMNLTAYLGEMARKGDIDESLINLEAKNSQGQSVDPFKQLLAKAGIRTKGEFAQTGDAFISTPENRILFPEYVSREYRDAETDTLNVLRHTDLVSVRVAIDGTAYRTGVIEAGQERDLEFGRVAEMGEIPVYSIKLADKAVNAHKFGGTLRMSYEAIRRTRLPIISRYIAKIARAEARRKARLALETAINGDGNLNPAPVTYGTRPWDLADLVKLQMDGLQNGVQFNIITGDSVELSSLFLLDIFTGAGATSAGADFRDNGVWPNILGMRPKMAMSGSVLENSRMLLGVDTANGLEEFFERGSELVESERLITSQFENIVISEVMGFAKPDAQAFRLLAER